MKTTIDNNQRVFQVIDSTGHQYFCNLKDLKQVITENNMHDGYYKVYEFWNNKPSRVFKTFINDMLKANKLETI